MNTRTITLIVLTVAVIGLVVWYMATHPAPTAHAPTTATSTAAAPTGTALGPQHITDNGQYYTTDAAYPGSTVLASTAGTQADAVAVASMKAFEAQSIDSFKKDNNLLSLTPEDVKMQGLDQDRTYSLKIEYTTQQSPRTVSYIYTLYADTLGAHPNGYYRTFTFDKATGTSLALSDLFTPGANYLATLSSAARAKLPAMIAKMEQVDVSQVDMDMVSSGTSATADNFANWYLDANGNLVLIFPPYAVGPYVLGTVQLPIPLTSLKSVLKPVYLSQ